MAIFLKFFSYSLVIFLTMLLIYFFKFLLNKGKLSRKTLPPGPKINIPFFGYLPFVDKWLYLTMSKLAHHYGPIFSLYFGSTFVVVLNDYKLVQETFRQKSELYSDRPTNNPFKFTSEKFLASDNGDEWLLHRRFMNKYMKNAGVGSDIIETAITNEVQLFLNKCESLRLNNPDTVNLKRNLSVSLVNNAFELLFGYRFDYDDPEIHEIMENEDRLTELYGVEIINFFVPVIGFFKRLLRSTSGIDEIKALGAKFDKFSEKIIKYHVDHPEKYTNGDYISAYLNEQKLPQQRETFTKAWLLGVLHPMFGGSSETSLSIVEFAILAMMRNPDLQRKIHLELDNFVGDRRITFSDRRLTPLTWATLLETLRYVTPVALGVPHSNRKETTINGFLIPKNSHIIANLWYIHNDPKLWEEPEVFRPQRFIKNGEVVNRPDLITFGIGKRSCPGETLATVQLYLYFASMMQNYEFHSVSGIHNLPLMKPLKPALVHSCPKYEIKLVKRKPQNY